MPPRADPGRTPVASGVPLGGPLVLATSALALAARLWSLGTFSMWLDEIIQTIQAEMPLGEMIASLRTDFVHPPLDASLTWILLRLGAGELGRRLVVVALGVLTVALLADLCSRRYGRAAGLMTGVVAALSPLHVQYSQELRPYGLALALVMLSLLGLDLWLESGRGRWLALCWASLALASLALYFAGIALAVLLVRCFQDGGHLKGARDRLRAAALLCSALGPSALWVAYAFPYRSVVLGDQPMRWSVAASAARLERLLVGGLEGRGATLAAALLATLLVVGMWRSLRVHRDASLLTGALLGTVGIESLLLSAGHWSNARFNLFAWPCLTALVGLGLAAVWQARPRTLSRLLALGIVAFVARAQIEGMGDYGQRGRPSWEWMARSAGTLAGSQGVILAGNDWAHLCLSYYLRRTGHRRVADGLLLVPSVAEAAERSRKECLYVVEGGYGQRRSRWQGFPLIQADPGGLGSALFRITGFESGLDCVWTVPHPWRTRPRAGRSVVETGPAVLPLDEHAWPHLLAGWSGQERSSEGTPYVWATGRSAVIALGGGPPRGRRLELHVWAAAPDQVVHLSHNGMPVGTFEIREVPSILRAPLAGSWREDNVIALELETSFVPGVVDPGSSDHRELSLALSAFAVEYEVFRNDEPRR